MLKCGATAALTLAALMMLVPAVSAQSEVDVFVREFEKAVDASDYTKMRSLTGDSKSIAFRAAKTFEKSICGFVSRGDEKSMEAANRYLNILGELALVYDLEHKDKLVKERAAWLKGLDDEQKKLRYEAIKASDEGYAHSTRGDREGGDLHYKNAIEPFTRSVEASTKIKDWFSVADDASQLAVCHEKANDGFAACYYAHVAIRAATDADMKSRFVDRNLEIHKRMKEKKVVFYPEIIRLDLPLEEARKQYEIDAVEKAKVPAIDPGGAVGGGSAADGSAPMEGGGLIPPTSELPYEFVDHEKKFRTTKVRLGDKIRQPAYIHGDENNPSRLAFQRFMTLEKDADPVDCRFIPGAKIKYDGKLYLDSAGKGKFKKIKLKNKPAPMRFSVDYDDNSSLRLAFDMWQTDLDFKLFGKSFTYDESYKYTRLMAINNTGLKGKLHGSEVTFIDCNANGVYHDEGIDAIMVGKGKDVRVDPFGRYVFLREDKGWYPYELKLNKKDASLVRTRPYKGQLAPLRVEYETASGAKPVYLIAKGMGEDASAYFDIAKAYDEPIWVPVGGYTIFKGYFTFGKGKKETNIFIGRGRSGTFKVEAGKINTWQLGGAGEQGFWTLGQFERGEKPSEIVAKGKEFRVFGNFGESYFGFTEERPLPSIVIRKEDENGTKVGAEETRHPGGSSVHEIDMWFPADVTIKNCPRGKCVGKFILDHPILGKGESQWLTID